MGKFAPFFKLVDLKFLSTIVFNFLERNRTMFGKKKYDEETESSIK